MFRQSGDLTEFGDSVTRPVRIVDFRALVSDPRIMTAAVLVRCRTPLTDRTSPNNGAFPIDGALVGNMALIGGWLAIGIDSFIGDPTVTSHTSFTGSRRCAGTGFGGRPPIAMSVHVGIEFICVLELALLLQAALLGDTVAFGRVVVELLRLGGSALRLGRLGVSVGFSSLGLGSPLLGVRFPGMDLMFGGCSLLPDPGCFLSLVFALLGGSLSADCDNDADDNQNYDDRYDYPDDGSCIHALSPCCLFGSH